MAAMTTPQTPPSADVEHYGYGLELVVENGIVTILGHGGSDPGVSTMVAHHLAVGTTIQALVQNVGTEIPWKQGTPVQAHLPADALRVLEDTGVALAPLDEGAVPA